MKSEYMMIGIALIVLLAAPFALAEETDTASAVASENLSGEPGITPDSFGYGLKLGWEKFGLWFTFNQEKKAQKEIEFARARLLEAKAMAEKGNAEGFARAQEAHDEMIERARNRIAAIQEDGDAGKIKEAMKKVSGLERAIEAHENRISVLKDILAEKNLSDSARTAIETAVARMENKTELAKENLDERKDNMKTKLRAVEGLSEEQVSEIIAGIDNETGLSALKKVAAEKRIEKAEIALEKAKEAINSGKVKNAEAAQEIISGIEEDIAEANALVESGDYNEALRTIKPVSNYGRIVSREVRFRNEIREQVKSEIKEARAEVKADIAEMRAEIAQKVKEQIRERAREHIEENLDNLSGNVQNQVQNQLNAAQ